MEVVANQTLRSLIDRQPGGDIKLAIGHHSLEFGARTKAEKITAERKNKAGCGRQTVTRVGSSSPDRTPREDLTAKVTCELRPGGRRRKPTCYLRGRGSRQRDQLALRGNAECGWLLQQEPEAQWVTNRPPSKDPESELGSNRILSSSVSLAAG